MPNNQEEHVRTLPTEPWKVTFNYLMMPQALFEEGGGSPHDDIYVARANYF
jgi:hypothetical protein